MYREVYDYIVFYGYMKVRYEIRYARLPYYEIAFYVYDKTLGRFVEVPENHEILRSYGFCYVSVIFTREIRPEDWRRVITRLVRKLSLYGAPLMKGVLVKNYVKQMFAKAVNREFDEAIRGRERYSRRRAIEYNKPYRGQEWVRLCYPQRKVVFLRE